MESREARGGGTLVSPLPPQLTQPLLSLPNTGDPETVDNSPNPALHMTEKTPLTSPGPELSTIAERERERERNHSQGAPDVRRQTEQGSAYEVRWKNANDSKSCIQYGMKGPGMGLIPCKCRFQ